MNRLLPALSFAALAGCVADVDSGRASLELAEPRTFFLAPADAKVTLRAALDHDGITDERVVDLLTTGGDVRLSVDDGQLYLDDLTVGFEDIALPAAIHPGDIVLTGIRVHLAQPIRCVDTTWSVDDDAASCTASTDLTLAWNAIISGTRYPLLPQTLPRLEVAIEVFRADGRLALDLDLHADGELWSYLSVARLSDPVVSLRTHDDPRHVP